MSARRPPHPDVLMPDQGRPLILVTTVRLIYQSIIVLGVYFLFAGHNLPGGGFVGGLIIGAAVSLRYVTGGLPAVQSTFPARPHLILGFGLVTAATTALVPILLGGAVLEHGYFKLHPPGIGELKVTSTLAFDIGVFLVVIGLVLLAFEAFGDDFDEVIDGGSAS
ncbi:MAG: MnhB domain-containing protein [Acidimicrobiia bacterium]|nr:MnhB domain-containing protein [Acidimicrobiia bacterium]